MDCEGGIVSIDCHIIIPAPYTHVATQKASIMMCTFCCLNAVNQTENKLSNATLGVGLVSCRLLHKWLSRQVGYSYLRPELQGCSPCVTTAPFHYLEIFPTGIR